MKGPKLPLLALLRGLYLAILLFRYEWPQSPLTITLIRGLYLAILLDPY
jgi:hypothetical protein